MYNAYKNIKKKNRNLYSNLQRHTDLKFLLAFKITYHVSHI